MTPTKYLQQIVVLLCLAVNVPVEAHAEDLHNYTSQEFGFTIHFPATWTVSPPLVPNSRVRIASPTATPHAECAVIVKRYPNAISAKQSDIDQIFSETPSPAELKDVLGQGGTLEVLSASKGTLHDRPAHLARVRYNAETLLGNFYDYGRVVMTATPGLTWTLSCNGQGVTPAEAEQSFRFWEHEINALLSSFKFK